MSKQVRILDKRIAKDFELVGILPGTIEIKGRTYDFRKMDKKTAQALVDSGCQFIRKKEKPAAKKDKGKE